MFDSPAVNHEQTRKVVGAVRGPQRDTLLAALLYRRGGEMRTTEHELRRLMLDVGHWTLACYVEKGTREIVLRLENDKGDVMYGDPLSSGGAPVGQTPSDQPDQP